MKLFLVLALASWALSLHISRPQDDDLEWELFKIEHEKVYEDEKEEHLRQIIFMKNLDFIRQHNKKYENGEVTFTVGVNQFADMELRSTMNGFRVPGGYVRKGKKFEPNETLTLPASVDWRLKGAVTGVKNQGKCGSCWAFSTTGSLEGQHYIKSKNLISLSEQNLIDCTKSFGNHGCRGGQVDFAFTYVLYNYGIDTEASYPYKAQDMSFCKYTDENRGATCTGYVDVTCGSEAELQQAVATIGPISVAIDASFESFKLYQSGIYMQPGCSTTALDHAVLVVGYNITFTGGQYWLVKNSWGTSWGMGGYIMMARNHSNMCGIASSASYPIV